MSTIQDVSPTRANTSLPDERFTSGRMLSLASSDSGRLVFAGSLSSNVWISEDGGKNWTQNEWPQPPEGQFGVAGAMGGYCVVSMAVGPDSSRWLVDRNPRFVIDISNDGRADIVGFGDTGVWTAIGNGDGTFQSAQLVLAAFGLLSGGWRVDRHPRLLGDLRGTGIIDIVGFGDDGVWTALGNGDGTFQNPAFVLPDLGFNAGGWRVNRHPRVLADLRGIGRSDIVAFGNAGVYVALSNGDGSFTFTPEPVLPDFGYDQGWRVGRHPRFVLDVDGDGFADIVGFGDAGVYIAFGRGDGTFDFTPVPVINDFGYLAGGWRVNKHPRFLADVRGVGKIDIVGFGNAGVYIAFGRGDGTFDFNPVPVINDFGFDAGGWRVNKHPRFVADVRGIGRGDIVGFGDAGVYVAYSKGDGTFDFTPVPVINDLGFDAGGWRVDKHPRVIADLGNGRGDIVGFGDAGVYVALANADGTYPLLRFVLPNFGFEFIVLAIVKSARESNDVGVWRSSDRGRNWSPVHTFPSSLGAFVLAGAGQLVWAPGTANYVFAAGGSSLAMSTDAGATFANLLALPSGAFQRVNHVAVARTPEGTLVPPVIYALFGGQVFVSVNGGVQFLMDLSPQVPANIGAGTGNALATNERVMAVSPRSPLEIFVTANAQQPSPAIFRADYSQFAATQQGSWQSLPLPPLSGQMSGNVFVATTEPDRGDALFYSPQTAQAFVAPVSIASPSDWTALDSGAEVHQDLHGIFLSANFAAAFEDGEYSHRAGTLWMASDGGIHVSSDGGKKFHRSEGIQSLSCVNIAGVSQPGKGPVISLNTGDNDGYTSDDGGGSWRPQNYGGGDNDCSYADPLRPHSMLVFTPRSNEDGVVGGQSAGQTVFLYETDPGGLPDLGSSNMRHIVPGPPIRVGSTLWNANSGFALRGYRPLVLNMPDDPVDEPGDYLFIRYFGNFTDGQQIQLPDNLAILLRTRRIRDVKKRKDWETPGHWRVEKHPRLLGDLGGTKGADIVAFGDDGVWTALGNGSGTFRDPQFVLADLGFIAGGWRVDKHVRVLADLRGNGRSDIVAFGDAGVFVALSNGDGTFAFTPQPVLNDFGFDQGWRVDRHPRFVLDINNDGFADIVGFGNDGVYVAFGNGDGTFSFTPVPVINDFGFNAGGWRVDLHPRFLADVRGIGRIDIVGFGNAGVYIAFGNGDGTFNFTPVPVIDDFGFDAGGWRVDKHPRFVADTRGIGRGDIVGFGNAGVYIAFSNGDGTFDFTPVPVIADFGFDAGGWRVDRHPRFPADMQGNGRADIVGFGNDGVYVAFSNGDKTFTFTAQPVINDFGFDAGGWRVDKHPRFLAKLTNSGRADVVGFGDAGVLVSVNQGGGAFSLLPLFVIPNFGYGDSGPFQQQGPFLPVVDIGVVQASGGHRGTVFYIGGDATNGLWKWTEGMAGWQRIVPGGGARNAVRFFVSPYDPTLVYLLDVNQVMRSNDGGLTWQVDTNLQQQLTCGGRLRFGRTTGREDGIGDFLGILLTDMQFDPGNSRRWFAAGLAGVFMTRNGGADWVRLLDTGAMPGRPSNCYFDRVSDPANEALYVSFAGRSIVKITGF